MSIVKTLTAISLCALLPLDAAYASKLPKTATKLSSAEVTKIYAGMSANYDRGKAYYAPDGTYFMVGMDNSWYGEGKWTVKGNKACTSLTWHSVKDGKSGNAPGFCNAWYKNGNDYWSLWDGNKGKKGYPTDFWYNGELKKMQNGDAVTATYNSLKNKK
ncbi:hypothetical protein ABID16_000334 [Rhizobium aquaticum]|uniref:DUF995 domain-containing protein n=1 Tax=Rhizobium aquaticum TaxID=1549636 RepID=A0ABV2IU60_9HYPH